MAFPAMIMQAGASVMQAFGSIFSGEAERNMYNYKAGVAQANAKIFEQNAAIAYDVGERQAQYSGMRTAQEVGERRAATGEGNLSPTTGSPAQVRESEIGAGRITQQNIRYGAAQSAFGQQVKAFGEKATAGLDVTAGKTAMESGEIGAVSSLLSGASSVAGKWQQASYEMGSPTGANASQWWTG
jgi:hypothetical protein